MHSGGNLTRIGCRLGTEKRTKRASLFGGKDVFSLLQSGFGPSLVKQTVTSQLSTGTSVASCTDRKIVSGKLILFHFQM